MYQIKMGAEVEGIIPHPSKALRGLKYGPQMVLLRGKKEVLERYLTLT